MCQFKSFIVFKEKIYWDKKKDSHSDMLEDLKVNDDSCFPNFVRVEVVPKDGDIFNHDLNNWNIKVDQDYKPEWFEVEEYESRIKEQMQVVFEQCFAVNDNTWKEYRDTKIFVKNSKIKTFNSSVEAWGNSSVEAWGNSSVVAWGNSSVVAWGNSSVVARENSSVVARENSSVVAWGNSSVLIPYSTSIKIKGVYDNASIKDLSSNPKIIIAKEFIIEQFK